MMRIALFLATNLAVMVVAGIVMNLLGVGSVHQANGQLNLTALLVMCAAFGFTGSFISLFMSKWMAKRSTRAYIIENPRNETEQWLLDIVAEMSEKAGIKMPEVGIFPSDASNAFATGWNKNSALVAVSAGMLQRFDRNEVKAVMAHEIGHVANGDMVTMTLIQGVVNTFVMFFARIIGTLVDNFLRGQNQGGRPGFGYYIASTIADLVLGFLASMIVAWFSRYREFRADEAGALYADKQSMIGALQRLQAEQGMPAELPESMSAFGIRRGLPHGMQKLFSTHPPLDVRIEALRNLG